MKIDNLLTSALLQPKSALTHLPLTKPQGAYFRSKILNANMGINPLLTAAAALLAFITHLREQSSHLDLHELYAALIHEIKAFEASAQKQGYRAEHILVARYLFCATLDEMLLTMAWGTEWQKYKLLYYFHGEDWGGERFFLILDRLSVEPAAHIDLLELIYLCLCLGFSGKYQQQQQGRIELDGLMEKLYECIRGQRGAIKKTLAIQEKTVELALPSTAPSLPLWLLLSFTALLLLTLYFGFNFMLESSITPLYQELNNIAQDYADD